MQIKTLKNGNSYLEWSFGLGMQVVDIFKTEIKYTSTCPLAYYFIV
jgi:hypothetical protein